MRSGSISFLLLIFLLGMAALSVADERGAQYITKELASKLVTIRGHKIALRDALSELTKQTGIPVDDRGKEGRGIRPFNSI